MSKEEFEARERVRLKVEEEQRKEEERKSVTVPSPVEVGSAGGDQFQDESEEDKAESETDSDSDWEDLPGQVEEKEDGSKSGYNTMKLKYFAMEADRYKMRDRAAAKLGNALLKDYGLIKKGSTSELICPGKVRRERRRWGGKLEEDHSAQNLPQGIYADGKRVDTLVRTTVTTRVNVRGKRGKGAYKEVSSTRTRWRNRSILSWFLSRGGNTALM